MCAVEDVDLEFYFIQVEPGQEEKLDEKILGYETNPPTVRGVSGSRITRYKGLGKYDLLCMSEAGLFQKEWLEEFSIDFEQVRCFAWQGAKSNNPLELVRRWEDKFDWIGICFTKLDPEYLCKSGGWPVVAEHRVTESLRRNLQSANTESLVLGGFGWHEVVILIGGDDLAEIAETVLRIPEYARTANDNWPVIKTFTVFGLSFDYLRVPELKRVKERTWARLNKKGAANLCFETFITCSSLPATSLERFLEKDRETFSVFGKEDLVSRTRPDGALGDFFEHLVEIRRRTADEKSLANVYSTSTVVELQHKKPSGPDNIVGNQGNSGFLGTEVASLLDKGVGLGPGPREGGGTDGERPCAAEVRRSRKQLHLVLRSSLRNRMTRDAYLDMIFLLAEFKRRVSMAGEHSLSQNSIKNLLDYISLGYQERCLGTMNALWNVGNPAPLFYRGGMQRLLWAAESLPVFLLGARGCQWAGFVVFGLTTDYLRSTLGVLSLPHRVMFNPEEWWGVFHEVGHEYAYLKGQDLTSQGGWRKIIQGVYQLPNEPYPGQEHVETVYAHLTWEVLSDIFDLVFGFGGCWELYQHTVIEYLLNFSIVEDLPHSVDAGYSLGVGSKLRDKIESYVVRLIATKCYSMGWESSEDVRIADLVQEVKPLFERILAGIALNATESDESRKEQVDKILDPKNLKACCERGGLWRLMFSEPGKALIKNFFERGEHANCEADKEFEPLKSGCVLPSLTKPAALVTYLLKLRRQTGGALATNVRIAAILSLWNAYAAGLPMKVNDLAKSYAVDEKVD